MMRHELLASVFLAAVITAGAVYIVTLQLEVRRLERVCPAGEVEPPVPLPTRPDGKEHTV